MIKGIPAGTTHTIPDDLRIILNKNQKILKQWESLTPLARNEWICWIISVKKIETRNDHIRRIQEDLLKGKRRPCCWAGCPHRIQ